LRIQNSREWNNYMQRSWVRQVIEDKWFVHDGWIKVA